MFSKNRLSIVFSFVLIASLVGSLFIASASLPRSAPAGLAAPNGVQPAASSLDVAQPQADAAVTVISIPSSKNDVSPALRDMTPLAAQPRVRQEEANENQPLPIQGHTDARDTVVQRTFSATNDPNAPVPLLPGPLGGFAGINAAGSGCNCAPPDPNGDVGPNNYVQTVNTSFAVYSKTGTLLYGPAAINTIWSGFGGPCQTRNDGDPVVLYDSIADRWLISQFTAASPYNECVAISTTGDPTGTWYRYAFQLSTSDFPDYPKLGVWPDGYYMSENWFTNGTTYAGPRPYVFDRAKMLLGQPATLQTTSAALGSSVNPMLPADFDGTTLPPANEPGLFVGFGSALKVYKFHVDWTTPANSTWTNSGSMTAASFTALCPYTRGCIPQPSTKQKLDGIGDRLMHRLAYRNMGTYEALVAVHSVNTGTRRNKRAGVRWYEIRNPAGTPIIYQQGSYSPDASSRWMGSGAMDKLGNIAVGFSVSSSSVYPSLRYTARLTSDPLGTMGQGEAWMVAGAASQTGVNRWGDYSALTVDPVDNCTFWYTGEYSTGGWNWATWIGSFKLPGCN